MVMASKSWQVGRLLNPSWKTAPHLSAADRLVGIELEYENVTGIVLHDPHNFTVPVLPYTPRWRAVRDGSLRNNGAEFVSEPIHANTVSSALTELFDGSKLSYKWHTSVRTGLHVHVDVRDFGLDELKSLLIAYCLSEPALFHYVGAEREENIFCVPWYRAPGDAFNILKWFEDRGGPESLSNYLMHLSKYDALNWMPLIKYGTIEFRHACSTKDIQRIEEWVKICVQVVDLALKYDPKSLLSLYLDRPDNFPEQHVHSSLATPDYEALMLRTNAEWLAQRMTYTEPAFDPSDKNAWIRINDKLPYKPKKPKGVAYLRLRNKATLTPGSVTQPLPIDAPQELEQDFIADFDTHF